MVEMILKIIFVAAIGFFSFSMGMLYEHYLNERSQFALKVEQETEK